jgi:hypothetical protein
MTAKELRVGNFIYYSDYRDVDNPYEIITAVGNDISKLMISDYQTRLMFSPIPLTDQWFEKFGGDKSEIELCSYRLYSLTRNYDFHKAELLDGGWYWWCEQIIGDTSITYVHELQNLFFALTKQELELIK